MEITTGICNLWHKNKGYQDVVSIKTDDGSVIVLCEDHIKRLYHHWETFWIKEVIKDYEET